MRPFRAFPSENSTAGILARKIAFAMGTAYNHADGTRNSADALAMGDALAALRAQVVLAIDQAFVSSATVMLDELEESYGLPVRRDMTNEARQNRLVAKTRAGRRGSPQGLVNALAPIASPTSILENLLTAVPIDPTTGDRRGQWKFGVLVPAGTYDSPEKMTQVRAVLDQMKPAHTNYVVGVHSGFFCDDADSLTDRDLLGS